MLHDTWGTTMDEEQCYAWGRLFASPWDEVVEGMAERARENGLSQVADGRYLNWMGDDGIAARFIFVDDPSDFGSVRRIYDDESNTHVPVTFIVVKQPDEDETRGDVVFDIFRLSPKSYLWHHNRVYTPPT